MARSNRPFICVLFECCRVYQRIYVNGARTAYIGWCPKCSARIEVLIDPSGSDVRFFSVR